VSKPGSHDHAASIAARKGLDAGLTRLGIALLTHVASRGTNFQTDAQVSGEITRPDGRRYHRESIGRKRREITRSGLLSAKRYYPGQRPPGATYRTPHGCVATVVLWQALKVSAPVLRGARRLERIRARAAEPRPPERPKDYIPAGELAELVQTFLHKPPK
jgi:hypothetical protein